MLKAPETTLDAIALAAIVPEPGGGILVLAQCALSSERGVEPGKPDVPKQRCPNDSRQKDRRGDHHRGWSYCRLVLLAGSLGIAVMPPHLAVNRQITGNLPSPSRCAEKDERH